MRTLRDLSLNRLTVSAETTIVAALLAMQKTGQAAAGVVEGETLKGIITIEACVLSDPDSLVKEVMRGMETRLSVNEPVRQAAKLFVRNKADYLAVFDQETYVGLLSALTLITELGRSWDPLTGLSWSDRLRDWGVDCLETGQEITILFFDLNEFGAYNKQYGHTVGDAVIRGFSALLTELVDHSRDVLVRYGGDEFAIGTTRSRHEALAMLQALPGREFKVKGVPAPVGFSVGVSGGKRTQEPSRDHVAATLDNLINLASKDCLANKPKLVGLAAVTTEPRPVQLELDVQVATESTQGVDRFKVHIRDDQRDAVGESSKADSRYLNVAEAALSALQKLNPGLQLTIDSIAFTYRDGSRYVEVWGQKIAGTESAPYHVRHILNGHTDASVAKAVVKAYSQATLVE